MKKILTKFYFTLIILVLLFESQGSYAQLYSVKSLENNKYQKTIAIKENDDIYGYIFLFEKDDYVISEVEYVITDLDLNEIKRGLFIENIESRPKSIYTKAIKSENNIYLIRKVVKPAENGASVFMGGGILGGLISSFLISLYEESFDSKEIPLLEEFKKINLKEKEYNLREGFSHFEAETTSFSSSKVKLNEIKKRDFIYLLYPVDKGLLVIEQNLFEKSKGRADSILFYDDNFKLKWVYTMPTSFKNIQGFNPLIKEFTSFYDKFLIYNCVEEKNRNIGNSILILDKQKGSVLNEIYIENKMHFDKIGYADFKFIFEDSLKTEMLVAARALDEYQLDKTRGIFLSYIDKNMHMIKSKTILFEDLSKALSEQYQDFFNGKQDIRINETFWYNNKIYIILQKKTALGYSDIAFLICDENFSNFKIKMELQHSISKMDYCTKPMTIQGVTFLNIFRKKVSLSFKQLIHDEENIAVRTNEKVISFDYDFVIDGKNCAIFCNLINGKTKIEMKKLSLFKG